MESKKQKHKKQPWSKVECFAFGGATVRFASLETSFHVANHTIPPPPSHEGYPHCTKDKNRSPFHGEKPLMITWFLVRRLCVKSPQTILHGRDAILRVRTKWLIFNILSQLWADVKYHVPTGFGFSPKGCFLCFLFLCPQHLSTEPQKRRRNSAGVCRLFLCSFV